MNVHYYDKSSGTTVGAKKDNINRCVVNPFKKVQQYYYGLMKITVLSCIFVTITAIIAVLSVKSKN